MLTDKMQVWEVLFAARNTLVMLSEQPDAWPKQRWLAERLDKLVAELGAVGELIAE